MSTLHQTPDRSQIIFVKGAPDQVISFCTYYQKNDKKEEMEESIKNKVLSRNRELAEEALRVLAIFNLLQSGRNNCYFWCYFDWTI